MYNTKIFKKIVIYSYIYENLNHANTNFIKELITFFKTICRQSPTIIFNYKNEICGIKTTLQKHKLNVFLQKLINFTFPRLHKNFALNNNILTVDSNFNINLILKNKTNFFEYDTNFGFNFDCIFNIKLIFNRYIDDINRLNYINNNLKIKLPSKHK